jgi:UPF0042 nucleotide-binding protein
MQLVIITGLSGSGKSIALKVLEDSGYYCVDNLPAPLLRDTVDFLGSAGSERVAISIDVRSGSSLLHLPDLLEQMKSSDLETHIVFLDAKAETLVKRFSETRRRHPLAEHDRTLVESIELERELLEEVGTLGNRIDTSDLNPNALRNWVRDLLTLRDTDLVLLFQSFGFKHGIPLDADFVFDVRCLPNPHYDPKLRDFTGRDTNVVEFLAANNDVRDMILHVRDYVERWLPCFVRDNRSYLTVAIGCTGGRHRSVYFAEQLSAYFGKSRQVLIRHRELAT